MSVPTRVYFDVENTLLVPFISGIQRVVREFSRRLMDNTASGFEFVPVVYCSHCQGWRKLSVDETKQLQKLNLGEASIVDSHSNYRKFAKQILGKRGKAKLRKMFNSFSHPTWHKECLLPKFESGSIFLDIDASWHNKLKRSSLLPALKASGVSVAALHYDIIPILFPEMTHKNTYPIFIEHLHAHLQYCDLFICISKNTEKDLLAYAGKQFQSKKLSTATIRLGCDINTIPEATTNAWPLPEKNHKYILCVGTLEPRKNHKLVLDAFDSLAHKYPDLNLVFVAREGWHAQETVDRIRSHKLYTHRLFWLTGIENSTLNELYRKAFLVVVPSFYEGFGLPVAESLRNGSVTLASNAGSLPEAGGRFCDYFSPSDVAELVNKIQMYLDDDIKYRNVRRSLMQYIPDTWDDASEAVVDIFQNLEDRLKA